MLPNKSLVFCDYDFLAKYQVRANRPTGIMLFFIDAIRRFLPDAEKRTLLDLGGGTNTYLTYIGGDYQKIAVDCSQDSLKKLAGVRTALGSLPGTGLSSGLADWVSASEVIEHLPPEIYEKSLMEIARLTKRYIAVSSPFFQHLESANVECEHCGVVYQCEGHFRSFRLNDIMHLQNYFGRLISIGFWGKPRSLIAIQMRYRFKQIRYFLRKMRVMAYPKPPFYRCPVCMHEEFHDYDNYKTRSSEPDQKYFNASLPLTRHGLFGDNFMAVFDRSVQPADLNCY